MKSTFFAMLTFIAYLVIFSLNFQIVKADEDDTSPYIVDGKATKRCSIPYIVKLRIFRSSKSVAYCSGTLLDNYHILTAGHCIKKKKVKTIRVDVIITSNKKTQKFRVRDWIIHKGYKYNTILVNDLAVLTLKKPVQYNACLKPIQLPKEDDHITRVCTISGWGFTKFNDTRMSNSLHYSNMVIRSPETCEMMGPMDRRYHLCTGDFHEGGPNICKGDSGGPLVCYLPNKKEVLLGVSSFIFDCNGNFAVFTNVITYVKWIKKQMMES